MTQPTQREIIGACPLDCPDACSWIVTLEDDKPVKLRGNKAHPFTRGTLCVKVNPYIEYSALPDRLLYPMKRIGEKGSGQFTRISWDEAIDAIATNLQETIAQHGAEAILPFSGTGTMGYIQGAMGAGNRLFNHLGASRHDGTICSVSGHVGMSYTTGSAAGMNPEDLTKSGVILLWGTNTLVSNRHLWPFIQEGRKAGATLVVVDPIRTKTAERADTHIALRPGTDGAFALGLMHQLVALGAIDRDYLIQQAIGWDGFAQTVLPEFTPENTAAICDIPSSQIIELAETIAAASSINKPLGIRLSMGMQRHLGGGQAARVVSCLPALLGDFNRVGGGICYSTGPAYKFNLDKLWGNGLRKQPARSLAMTRLGHSLLELNDPPVKSLLMWAANPVVSNPDQNRIRRGLAREDLFTVIIENFQTDSADYADILLPGTMQLEHPDLHDSFSHLYVNWNNPAVDPPGECLSHNEIFRRLARRMGVTEPLVLASDDELAEDALNTDHPAVASITLAELKEKGFARLNWPDPFLPFAEKFWTASGKFEFKSERAEQDGFGLYPHYVMPAESAEHKAGTFALVSPANNFLLNSMFANSPHHKRAGEPFVALHVEDAAEQGVSAGDMVRVYNERGAFVAKVRVSAESRRGVALTSKGLWAKHNNGVSVNATVVERDSDMGRGAVFHDNRVRIERL